MLTGLKFTLLSGISYRPLATSLDDKVTLQDCLESGRQAKVNIIYLFIYLFYWSCLVWIGFSFRLIVCQQFKILVFV